MLRRVLEHDRAAEGVADERRRREPEPIDEAAQVVDEFLERVRPRRLRALACSAQVRDDDLEVPREFVHVVLPDRRPRSAEPVQEHDRRSRALLLVVKLAQCCTSAAEGIGSTPAFARWIHSIAIVKSASGCSSCGRPSVFTITLPSFITIASFERSWRMAMSSSGSPSTTSRSANLPGSIVPVSSSVRISCEPCLVAATIASIGEKPMSVAISSMSFAYSPCGHQTKP